MIQKCQSNQNEIYVPITLTSYKFDAGGKELQTPIYKFVKEALIKKFGEDWYLEIEKTAKYLQR